jgi:transposase
MPPDVETPEVARPLISTPKLMVTIFWNVWGIHVIDYVPSGESFNSSRFIEQILPTIAGLPARHAAVRQRKAFVLHLENSPMHTSRAVLETMASIPVQLAPHPPYSPDLAPSDFFLFGHLKGKMIGREFDSPDALIAWIKATFEALPKPGLEQVFEEWIRRVEQCIDNEGSYFPES